MKKLPVLILSLALLGATAASANQVRVVIGHHRHCTAWGWRNHHHVHFCARWGY